MPDTFLSNLPSLHVDRAEFAEIRQEQGLYVDKTRHFATLLAPAPATDSPSPRLQNRYVFLARPRRFGKSLLIATLEAWFQGVLPPADHPEPHDPKPDWLFANTDGYAAWRAQPLHPVIRLNISTAVGNTAQEVEQALLGHLEGLFTLWAQSGVSLAHVEIEWEWVRGQVSNAVLNGTRTAAYWFSYLIRQLHQHYGTKAVVLIDEYDAPVTHLIGNARITLETRRDILNTLGEFYRVLKNQEAQLHFVFVTGISYFGKVNVFSALNNLQDISLKPEYTTLCGFTDEEVQTYLAGHLDRIAQRNALELAVLRSQLRDYYNGYRFTHVRDKDIPQVHNPFSLLSCLNDWQDLHAEPNWLEQWRPAHWAATATPSLLIRVIQQGQYESPQRDLDPATLGTRLSQISYDLNRIDYAALMWQTGYYTWRFGETDALYWDYPNREVRESFMQELQRYLLDYRQAWPGRENAVQLYHLLVQEDFGGFVRALDSLVAGIPGDKLTAEADFHLVLHVLSYILHSEFQSEVSGWARRCDMVHRFPDYLCIVEVQYNGSASAALAQIEKKQYAKPFHHLGLRIVGLGINFARKSRQAVPEITWQSRELHVPPRRTGPDP